MRNVGNDRSRRRVHIMILTATVAAVVMLVLGSCQLARRNALRTAEPGSGDVVAAFVGDLSSSASASGQLVPSRKAKLALGLSGVVKQVHVQVGDLVQAGDVLVELESDDLQRAVENAEQTLTIRQANLAELLKEPSPQDLASAQAAVENAQTKLDDLLAGPSEKELAQARATLDTAQARLDDLLAGPSAEELAQARAAVSSAQAGLGAAKARTQALAEQVAVAQNDIHTAQLGMDRARDIYNLLIWNDWKASVSWAPYSPQGAAVKNAQIAYDVAVANLTLAEINANDVAVRGAQAQLAQAETALASLTEDKTAQIAAARAQLARATANLATLTGDNAAQIASARAQLAQAQANLDRLLAGATDGQVAVARAQVEQARISLEDARANLANATLTAPFAGTVTQVYVAVGERAVGPAVDLVDFNSLQVVLDVDEIDVGNIEAGQPTVVALETWPDQDLPGQVVSIAPKARTLAGIVTFEVRISLDAGDLPVREGMTANAELITASRENVLLVPNRAITADRQAGEYYVNLVRGGETQKTQVIIGLRDSSFTEIKSGLQEGDQVLVGEVNSGLDLTQGPPSGFEEMRQP